MYYYLDKATNNPKHIDQQLLSLNKYIIAHCMPGIIESIKSELKYRHDISHMHVPIPRSISTTKKGLINNEFKRFF